MTNQHARQDVLRVLHRLCSQDIKTHDSRSLESKAKQQQQKNQTTHLSAYWVPGLLRGTFSLTLPFPFKVWSETVKPSRITGNSLRSFGETEGERDACTETSWCIHPSQSIKHPGRGTRCKLSAASYLCALPSPFCRSSMISGTVWAGSLGLSKYNRTFLPYLSFTMLGRELMISYIIKKQKAPLQHYLHSKFRWDLMGTSNTPLAISLPHSLANVKLILTCLIKTPRITFRT